MAEIKSETENTDGNQSVAVIADGENSLVITEDQLQAYYIVKAIVCDVIDTERIVYRNTVSYFGILCDDNNRRPVCRLHFKGKQKFIGVMDADKNEQRIPINSLNEIYKLADRLKTTVASYANNSRQSSSNN